MILSLLAKVGEWIYYQIKFRKRSPAGKVGFSSYGDFAKDPNRVETVKRIFEMQEDDLRSLRAMLIGELVAELATRRARRNVATALEERAGAAMPSLLKALSDPRFRVPYTAEHREEMDIIFRAETPVEAVLRCLRAHPHPLMVPAVLPFAADASDRIRRPAADILCEFPDDKTLPVIKTLLMDADQYVRENAAGALKKAAIAGRASAAARDELYPIVLSLVTDEKLRIDSAPAGLLALDRARATADLTAASVLSLENRRVASILKALHQNGIEVSDAQVHRLMAESEAKPTEYPHYSVLDELLGSLARTRSPLLSDALARNERSASPDVREAVARARCILGGLPDPWKSAWAQIEEDEGAAPPPVRNVILCRYLIDQVNNGGFSQYFTNGYGREWRPTIAALEAVGASHAHALLNAAVAKFGPDGPSLSSYISAVSEFHQKHGASWKSEDSAFYNDEDGREALLLQYMLANKQYFQ